MLIKATNSANWMYLTAFFYLSFNTFCLTTLLMNYPYDIVRLKTPTTNDGKEIVILSK